MDVISSPSLSSRKCWNLNKHFWTFNLTSKAICLRLCRSEEHQRRAHSKPIYTLVQLAHAENSLCHSQASKQLPETWRQLTLSSSRSSSPSQSTSSAAAIAKVQASSSCHHQALSPSRSSATYTSSRSRSTMRSCVSPPATVLCSPSASARATPWSCPPRTVPRSASQSTT